MRIYLDNCCFNRPFDDQMHPVIKLETEAKLHIQQEIFLGHLDLIWSFILHYENNDNPYIDRKNQIGRWENRAVCVVTYSDAILKKANILTDKGIKTKDALHLACALEAKAEFFITTDKKLLNKTIRGINIINPVDFLRRLTNED